MGENVGSKVDGLAVGDIVGDLVGAGLLLTNVVKNSKYMVKRTTSISIVKFL